jgi:hypothetical protein
MESIVRFLTRRFRPARANGFSQIPFAFWLEAQGFDVTYISNLDTHVNPAGLHRAKVFSPSATRVLDRDVSKPKISVAGGLSVGFFSGNTCCGRINPRPSPAGAPPGFGRVGVFGPPGGTRDFEAMKTLPHERPYANELIGAHSTGPVTGGADWICAAPDHWIFAGTRMKKGDGIPGLVGWEWHGDPAKIPGLEIVASGPTQDAPGKPNGGVFTAMIYPGPRGNFVFNTATCWWADGLSEPPGYVRPSVYTTPHGPDPRGQQITANLLERMRGSAGRTN